MIGFRFDIDTRFGLVERVPPLLDLLDEHGIRASFFCVMGREANLAEIVRLRLLADKSSKSRLNVRERGGPVALAVAALAPRGVGHRHPGLLREIVRRGHELAPHGWKHIQWQRNIDRIDVREHLRLAIDHYERIVGRRPAGFASPGRTWNEAALAAFDEAGLLYSCDMDGERPFRPEGRRHLQLPLTRFESITQMRRRGLTDDEIVATYLGDVDANPGYCALFEHPDDLDEAGRAIFGRVFAGVRARELEPATHAEIARAWLAEESPTA